MRPTGDKNSLPYIDTIRFSPKSVSYETIWYDQDVARWLHRGIMIINLLKEIERWSAKLPATVSYRVSLPQEIIMLMWLLRHLSMNLPEMNRCTLSFPLENFRLWCILIWPWILEALDEHMLDYSLQDEKWSTMFHSLLNLPDSDKPHAMSRTLYDNHWDFYSITDQEMWH